MFFKILDTKTGLFRKAGRYTKYTKLGKIWNLSNHLTNSVNNFDKNEKTDDIFVVEYELVEKMRVPLSEYIELVHKRKRDRYDEFEKRKKEYQEKLEREEYEKLKKKFGDK